MLPYFLVGCGVLLFLLLVTAYICFRLTFSVSRKKKKNAPEYEIPPGEAYEPFRERIVGWIKSARALPHEEIYIRSHDGLLLHGMYYECAPGAPIEILFHGYRGNAERDMSAGIERCFTMGRNALLVDQRASGKSEGHVITFGAKEQRDCLAWANYVAERFGKGQKIILSGVSMGGATVMLATAHPLPPGVVCVLADCGYSSTPEIIKKVLKEDLRLSPRFFYPFIRAGAILFGRFDPNRAVPKDAVAKASVPIVFIHGDADAFVPHKMSEECFAAASSAHKKLSLIKGAAHGLAFPTNGEEYYRTLYDFQKEIGF